MDVHTIPLLAITCTQYLTSQSYPRDHQNRRVNKEHKKNAANNKIFAPESTKKVLTTLKT